MVASAQSASGEPKSTSKKLAFSLPKQFYHNGETTFTVDDVEQGLVEAMDSVRVGDGLEQHYDPNLVATDE